MEKSHIVGEQKSPPFGAVGGKRENEKLSTEAKAFRSEFSVRPSSTLSSPRYTTVRHY